MERDRIVLALGRPRSAAAHRAILESAIGLIREVGYDAVSMDGIAARAGVGKATVYRRWSSKELLIAEALEGIMSRIRTPETGHTRNDLVAVMRDTVKLYRDPATNGLLSGLVAAMARNQRIGDAVRSGLIARRRAALRSVIERGMERGDLRAGLDPELVVDLLNGALVYRALLTGGAVDDRLARDVVEVVLRGISQKGAV